ncbi:hypothetical protein GCM10010988_09920 [Cnuibacter physcomitrellae]|nr:hypothetical protein GCM10010988_09920 [Cnuibacter physcomitrellae]
MGAIELEGELLVGGVESHGVSFVVWCGWCGGGAGRAIPDPSLSAGAEARD